MVHSILQFMKYFSIHYFILILRKPHKFDSSYNLYL